MINDLRDYQAINRCTLLGVGPMSKNCVDAVIDICNQSDFPLMLIASRRQIDSLEFGGGYVNSWDTQEFGKYVLTRRKKNNLILARDHGGPWQSIKEVEQRLEINKAIESAKVSFRADIDAGFEVLHIDPSIDIHEKSSIDSILHRVFELYEYCYEYSQKVGKEVIFEVGTDEQSGSTNTPESFEYVVQKIDSFCEKNKIKKPTFVVAQTGTKVLEMENVGSFESPVRIKNEVPSEIFVPRAIEICEKYGLMLKAHNTDYLGDESLYWHPRLGIHAANVAPEFGVAESIKYVDILEKFELKKEADNFLDLAYKSLKWMKWMKGSSVATDRDKALIAGHYVFSNPQFLELKNIAQEKLRSSGVDIDETLKAHLKERILRYVKFFRLGN